MLSSLQIRDFAIVDRIEVEFAGGLTVLTGETGAGKSILVDALGLVLGERGGTGLVRAGADRAEFSAEFDLRKHPAANAWLGEQSLDADGQCILRRIIGADGRSRAFINGSGVTLQSLKALGELLLDIHGQHFHQSLGRHDVQRELLDHFGKLQAQNTATGDAYRHWQALDEQLSALQTADADRASRLDLLRFQLSELHALDLQADELAELQAEREKLNNSGKLADGVSQALGMLFENEPADAHSLLAQSRQLVDTLTHHDIELTATAGLLQDAVIQVAEAADLLRRYAESLDADPARRDSVEERIDAIRTLARKHRVESDQLPALGERVAAELDELQHANERGAELSQRAQAAERGFAEAAGKLSAARRAATTQFASAVSKAMRDLGMPDGVFEVTLLPRDLQNARAWGLEDIEYRISANAGQPPMPLARIASGGELSRMSLAIQVIARDGSVIPTMVFDEVDSGVGGGIAEKVGRRLHDVATHCQVLCVTHLPQVASQADHHLRISKISDGKSTHTRLDALQGDERVDELARMLGGVEITERTRAHAAEMLNKGSTRGNTRRAAK